MNLIIDDYKENYVHFHQPVKNTVMDNSSFIRVGYSNSLMKLNGVYVIFNIKATNVEKYFNKSKYFFNYSENEQEIQKIISIEKTILDRLDYDKSITRVYKLKEQLLMNNIRVFCNNEESKIDTSKVLVKISGVWQTDKDCGLTFKFFNISHQ